MGEARALLLHVVVVGALWGAEVVVALRRVPRALLLEVDEPRGVVRIVENGADRRVPV